MYFPGPNDLKKALIVIIVAYSAILFGLGYWVASHDSEPPAPPALLAPQNRDID